MDFDPNPLGGGNRSGGAWKVIAFIVIASLLLLNAIAIFVNAAATRGGVLGTSRGNRSRVCG